MKTKMVSGLGLIIVLAVGLTASLFNPAFRAPFVGDFRGRFDRGLPIRRVAASAWSAIRYALFREGSDGVIVGRDGWLFTKEELDYSVVVDDAYERMERVIEALEARGVPLIVVLIPSKARVYPEKLGRARLPDLLTSRYEDSLTRIEAMGAPVPDLSARFRFNGGEGRFFLRTDTHWTAEGAMIAADAVKYHASPILNAHDAEPRDFVVEEVVDEVFHGDLMAFLPFKTHLPWLGPKPETVLAHRTVEVDPPQIGLFDDVMIPVILVGTSFSLSGPSDFEGAIKRSLRADVLNVAEPGRGPFAPMDDLLSGDTLESVTARLVVWEIPERYLPISPHVGAGGD